MKRLCRNIFADPVFQDYRSEIQTQNFQMLRMLGRTAAAVSLALVLAAWNVELAICSKEFYFSIMAAGVICMVLCYFWPDAARRHSAALLVLLGAVIMTVAIISGTVYYPEGASGAVPAFLCIVPFAVLIPLGWFYLFEAGFCALFVTLALLCEAPEVAVVDVLNGAGTVLISCIIGTRVSASIGATLCHAGEAFESLYRRADRALYRVKENGRDGHLISRK